MGVKRVGLETAEAEGKALEKRQALSPASKISPRLPGSCRAKQAHFLVDQNSSSWNRLTSRLRKVEALRSAA
jgi:hypothetical protein